MNHDMIEEIRRRIAEADYLIEFKTRWIEKAVAGEFAASPESIREAQDAIVYNRGIKRGLIFAWSPATRFTPNK